MGEGLQNILLYLLGELYECSENTLVWLERLDPRGDPGLSTDEALHTVNAGDVSDIVTLWVDTGIPNAAWLLNPEMCTF